MRLIASYVIVPLSFLALLSGLVQSLGSAWGLFRHYWILAKLLLTSIATAILLGHMKTVNRAAKLVTETSLSGPDYEVLRTQLVIHAAGGLLVLIIVTVLSLYKPWGLTPFGRKKLQRKEK